MNPGEVLFLSRENIAEIDGTNMEIIVPEIEEAFAALHAETVIQPAKTTLRFAGAHEKYNGLVNVLPAALQDSESTIFGLKTLGAMPANVERGIPRATGLVVLFDGETKTPRAIMDGQIISAMRTGAVSALAAKKLCHMDSETLGLIGAGVNMRTQLLGLVSALPKLKTVKVYSRGESKRAFVRDMSTRFPAITFQATDSAENAVESADVVVTCVANSDAPVVKKEALNRPGITVFNIGCLENEPELLSDMDMIVSDYWEHSKHRGVQTHAVAFQRGIIRDDDVTNLDEIIVGAKLGRETNEQRIFFCPTGLGVEDIAVARRLVERAEQQNVGAKLQLWSGESWI